jgi:hypothetical protein
MIGQDVPPIVMSKRLIDIYIDDYLAHRDRDCPCGATECDKRQVARRQLADARVHTDLWWDAV